MSFGRRLLSGRHWASKLVLIVGIVMGAEGSFTLVSRAQESDRRDRLYRDVIDAVASRQDAAVLDRAIAFLKATSGDRGEDPRFSQVASFLDRASLRHVAALHVSGKKEEAEATLARYRSATAELSL